MSIARTRYDEIPYPDFIHLRTDPAHLAAIAQLHGVPSASPTSCRVLELGCGRGANLLSLASLYPESEFLGVDLSASQIEAGEQRRQLAGLSNVNLRQHDIQGGLIDQEPFDFIIAHGVYSWVPKSVRDQLLTICRDALSPQGLAVISFNAYPGWHMKSIARDILRDLASRPTGSADPTNAIEVARDHLAQISEIVPKQSAYGMVLREQVALLAQSDLAYLHHEQFESVNDPCLFSDFAKDLSKRQLQHVADANVVSVEKTGLPKETRDELSKLPSTVAEQRLDFLINRTFRESIITHESTKLRRDVDLAELETLELSSSIRLRWTTDDHDVEMRSETPVSFSTSSGLSGVLRSAVTKAAVHCLGRAWPESMSWTTLVEESAVSCGIGLQQSDANLLLQRDCWKLVETGLVQVRRGPIPCRRHAGERPRASRLARVIARDIIESCRNAIVPTQRHTGVNMDTSVASVLDLLTGERSVQDLERDWTAARRDSDAAMPVEPMRHLTVELDRLAQAGFILPT
ncbi:MAG: methyltransferase regulatory domain-containing protein [Planctomycetota bacterium]